MPNFLPNTCAICKYQSNITTRKSVYKKKNVCCKIFTFWAKRNNNLTFTLYVTHNHCARVLRVLNEALKYFKLKCLYICAFILIDFSVQVNDVWGQLNIKPFNLSFKAFKNNIIKHFIVSFIIHQVFVQIMVMDGVKMFVSELVGPTTLLVSITCELGQTNISKNHSPETILTTAFAFLSSKISDMVHPWLVENGLEG